MNGKCDLVSTEVGAKNWFSRSKERRKSKSLCASVKEAGMRSGLICPSNQIVLNQSRINHSHAEAGTKTASLIAFPARTSFRRRQPLLRLRMCFREKGKSDLGEKQWILTAPIPAPTGGTAITLLFQTPTVTDTQTNIDFNRVDLESRPTLLSAAN